MRKGIKKDFLGNVASLLVLTLGVKVIGFFRQMVIAAVFGAGESTDIYFIATDFFANISAVIFTPVSMVLIREYAALKLCKGFNLAEEFAYNITIKTAILSGGIAVFVMAFSNSIAFVIGGARENEAIATLAKQLFLLAPTCFFFGVATLTTGWLQAKESFKPLQIRGAIRSLIIIVFCFLSFFYSKNLLILGFIVAVFCEALFCSILTIKHGFTKISCFNNNLLSFKSVANSAFFIMLANGAGELASIVDKAIAARLYNGGPSALAYAYSVQSIFFAVLVSNVGAVCMPKFSNAVASNSKADKENLSLIVKVTIVLATAFAIAVAFSSKEIVQILFFRGRFDQAALNLTASALSGYSFGVVPLGAQTVLLRWCYAQRDKATPLLSGGAALVVNVALSLVLSKYFGIFGVAAASTVAYFVSMAVVLHRINVGNIFSGKILLATIAVFSIGLITVDLKLNFIAKLLLNGGFLPLLFLIILYVLKEETVIILRGKILSFLK